MSCKSITGATRYNAQCCLCMYPVSYTHLDVYKRQNDTWARDHGAITMMDVDAPSLLDFTFNGWGLKFASDLDNQITRRAIENGVLKGRYVNRLGFVLEGGSIESDGMGTLPVSYTHLDVYKRQSYRCPLSIG